MNTMFSLTSLPVIYYLAYILSDYIIASQLVILLFFLSNSFVSLRDTYIYFCSF